MTANFPLLALSNLSVARVLPPSLSAVTGFYLAFSQSCQHPPLPLLLPLEHACFLYYTEVRFPFLSSLIIPGFSLECSECLCYLGRLV